MLHAHENSWNLGAVAKRGGKPELVPLAERPPITGDYVGARIRSAYEGAGLNRSQFAKLLDVSYSTVDSWDQPPGHKRAKEPELDNVRNVSEVLGVSVAELLGESPTHVETAWVDKAAWIRLVRSGRIDDYRRDGLTEAEIEQARRYDFRGEPDESDYERILSASLRHVLRQEAEPARAARERREREGGPDLSDEIAPKKKRPR